MPSTNSRFIMVRGFNSLTFGLISDLWVSFGRERDVLSFWVSHIFNICARFLKKKNQYFEICDATREKLLTIKKKELEFVRVQLRFNFVFFPFFVFPLLYSYKTEVGTN